jgi:hypothetical protein
MAFVFFMFAIVALLVDCPWFAAMYAFFMLLSIH